MPPDMKPAPNTETTKKKDEELKEAVLQAQAEAEERKRQQQQQNLTQEAEQTAKAANAKEEEGIAVNPTTFTTKKPTPDWDAIIEDYKTDFPERKLADNALSFESQQEAIQFFLGQAQSPKNREFFCQEVMNGVPSPFYIASFGTEKSYNGKLEDIQAEINKDLKNASPEQTAKLQKGLSTIDAQMKIQGTMNMREELKKTVKPEEPSAAAPVESTGMACKSLESVDLPLQVLANQPRSLCTEMGAGFVPRNDEIGVNYYTIM